MKKKCEELKRQNPKRSLLAPLASANCMHSHFLLYPLLFGLKNKMKTKFIKCKVIYYATLLKADILLSPLCGAAFGKKRTREEKVMGKKRKRTRKKGMCERKKRNVEKERERERAEDSESNSRRATRTGEETTS